MYIRASGTESAVPNSKSVVQGRLSIFAADIIDFLVVLWVAQMYLVRRDSNERACRSQ